LAPSINAADAPSIDAFQPVGEASTGSFVDGALPLTPDQYIAARIPRVPDSPSSAPIYDQVTQAVSYPKTFCVSSKDQQLIERASSKMTLGYKDGRLQGCRCNTQQGSKIEISFDVCMATVENGFFDPAKPDKAALQQQAVGAVGAHEERGATAEPTARRGQGMQVTVINSGKPGHLW
jgi:zona occludens toxin